MSVWNATTVLLNNFIGLSKCRILPLQQAVENKFFYCMWIGFDLNLKLQYFFQALRHLFLVQERAELNSVLTSDLIATLIDAVRTK